MCIALPLIQMVIVTMPCHVIIMYYHVLTCICQSPTSLDVGTHHEKEKHISVGVILQRIRSVKLQSVATGERGWSRTATCPRQPRTADRGDG